MSLPAGTLRQVLVFQKKTEEQSRSGAITEEWPTEFKVYGGFETIGSREFPTYQKRHAESTARFRIRYRSDLDSSLVSAQYRISFRNRSWNIYPPLDPDGKRVELRIEASEVV